MEFKQVIGLRRSIRYHQPYRPVERAKVQSILEATRLCSQAINSKWRRRSSSIATIWPRFLPQLLQPIVSDTMTLAVVTANPPRRPQTNTRVCIGAEL